MEKQEEMKSVAQQQNKRNNRKFKIVKKGCIAAKRLAKQLTKKDGKNVHLEKVEDEESTTWFIDLADCCTCNAAKDYSTSSSYD